MSNTTKQTAWAVFAKVDGYLKKVDTVFYNEDCNDAYVADSERDNYPGFIKVRDESTFHTRAQRLNNDCSHAEYYREIADDMGYSFDGMLVTTEQVKIALESGDKHLNTIPIKYWYMLGGTLVSRSSRAFRMRGDYPTQAGLVCLVKEAAKRSVED